MILKDLLLALLIVAVWGANFTVIKIGLAGVPPMLLAALRYVVVAFPAVFFVARPRIGAAYVVAYGLTVGVGQFGALFYAMNLGMPAGLASVIPQSQALFTVLFAAAMLGERITRFQAAGMLLSTLGLGLIAHQLSGGQSSPIPLAAFFLTLAGAASWGLSNIVVRLAAQEAMRKGRSLDMLSLVVWSALVPPVPLFFLSWILDSPQAIARSLAHLDGASLFAIAFIAYGATLVGFGGWSRLLARYPASVVAPFSLLVPVTGLLTAWVVLGERLTPLQALGSVAVIGGLLISTSMSAARTRKRLSFRRSP